MVGLEFWVGFRRPIYADETIRLEWLVIKVTPNINPSLAAVICPALGGHPGI